MSVRDLAATFNVPASTVYGHLKHRTIGEATLRVHKGPPPKDLTADIARVREILAQDPLASVTGICKATGWSRMTCWRRLEAAGCHSASRPTAPWSGGDPELWRITRLQFAKRMLEEKIDRASLLFVDESMFRVCDDRKTQWINENQEPRPREEHSWAAGAHVWACIGVGFKCLVNLSQRAGTGPRGGVTSSDYVAFLEEEFLPSFRRHQRRHPNRQFWFIQDGARIHMTDEVLDKLTSWGLRRFERKNSIEESSGLLVWPAHSPDLNPIENLWAVLKRQVNAACARDLSNSAAARAALWAEIQRQWRSMSNSLITRLVDSFKTRLESCVLKKGGVTGY